MFTPLQRRQLAEAWRLGGCQILGLRLSKIHPHFSVRDYAAAVKAAREETRDDTDYSQESSDDMGMLTLQATNSGL